MSLFFYFIIIDRSLKNTRGWSDRANDRTGRTGKTWLPARRVSLFRRGILFVLTGVHSFKNLRDPRVASPEGGANGVNRSDNTAFEHALVTLSIRISLVLLSTDLRLKNHRSREAYERKNEGIGRETEVAAANFRAGGISLEREEPRLQLSTIFLYLCVFFVLYIFKRCVSIR